MEFVVTVFGQDYLPFLSVCLESLSETHPYDPVTVLWDDIPEHQISLLSGAFERVAFRKARCSVRHRDFQQRISLKIRFWRELLRAGKSPLVCFLDCDSIVYKNIRGLLEGEYDVLYTHKPEKFPLNTGVLCVRPSGTVDAFFREWLARIERIVRDRSLLRQACARHGAADQQAFADLLGGQRYDQDSSRDFRFGRIRFKAVPCSLLNQTNSVPVDSGAYVFHFKGGWHPVLQETGGYGVHRSPESSEPLYALWNKMLRRADDRIMRKNVFSACLEHERDLPWADLPFEARGILNSEMLAIVALVKRLGVEVVIESGRFRGYSTWVLAEALRRARVAIVSIDMLKDDNTLFAERRLRPYRNVRIVYGDAQRQVEAFVRKYRSRKIALLFDGPKGAPAYELFCNALNLGANVAVGFFHDCRRPSEGMENPSRDIIGSYFDRIFFTDDAEYVARFRDLDAPCLARGDSIDEHSWRPYMKGTRKIGSYGPTLAVVFPWRRDVERWLRGKGCGEEVAVV